MSKCPNTGEGGRLITASLLWCCTVLASAGHSDLSDSAEPKIPSLTTNKF